MDTSVNDTIDLKNDTIDLKEEVDDFDEVLAGGSISVAEESRRVGWVEWALVAIANVIWAVVGLVLWLPQVTRALLWTVLRTVHSALTGQQSGRAVAAIEQVSRSYVERFLHRRSEQAWVGRRHELRPFRLVGEVAWASLFYLVLLRWLAPGVFGSVWTRLAEWGSRAEQWSLAALATVKGWLAPAPGAFEDVGVKAATVVFAALFIGLALGFWLGRRGR